MVQKHLLKKVSDNKQRSRCGATQIDETWIAYIGETLADGRRWTAPTGDKLDGMPY